LQSARSARSAIDRTPTGNRRLNTKARGLSLNFSMLPLDHLKYPGLDHVYHVGENIDMRPSFEGTVEHFWVQPALPSGLQLNTTTGCIVGKAEVITKEASYVITACNKACCTQTRISFSIEIAPPDHLSYSLSPLLRVGEYVKAKPLVDGVVRSFAIEPLLPPGMQLASDTGRISGAPLEKRGFTKFLVTARNEAGETSTQVFFEVQASLAPELTAPPEVTVPDSRMEHDSASAASSMEPRPTGRHRTKTLGIGPDDDDDVHVQLDHSRHNMQHGRAQAELKEIVERAINNDPSLTEIIWMRTQTKSDGDILLKLMDCMRYNSHLVKVSLVNVNLGRDEIHTLCRSLEENNTLQYLDISGNGLGTETLVDLASAIGRHNTAIQQLYVNQGGSSSAHVEEHFAKLVQTKHSIVKLGLVFENQVWRQVANTALLKNLDRARRTRKQEQATQSQANPELRCSDAILTLLEPPTQEWSEFFNDANSGDLAFSTYLWQVTKTVPKAHFLQASSKKMGIKGMTWANSRTVIDRCTRSLFKAAHSTTIQISGMRGVHSELEGSLSSWEIQSNLRIEVDSPEGKFTVVSTAEEPVIHLSPEWQRWFKIGTVGEG